MNLRDLGIKLRGRRWRMTVDGPTDTGNYVVRIFRGNVLLAAGIDRDLPMAVQDALDDASGVTPRARKAIRAVPVDGADAAGKCHGCGVVIAQGRGRPKWGCAADACQAARRQAKLDADSARKRAKRERSAAE